MGSSYKNLFELRTLHQFSDNRNKVACGRVVLLGPVGSTLPVKEQDDRIYLPFHTGSRFSAKALKPSMLSSLP